MIDQANSLRSLYGDSDHNNDGIKQFFVGDDCDCGIHLFFKVLIHFAHLHKAATTDLEAWELEQIRKVFNNCS